ncbi:MAG: hypothetical protein ACRDY7_11380, partial [Acidimicrobiia bacterium]
MRPDRLVPRLALVGLLGAVVVFFFPAAPASAHPLGNFTVNQHLGVGISSDHLEVTLVTDMAEIPAFQTRRDIDSDGDGAVSAQENVAWQDSACADRSGQVRITINGSRLPIEPAGVELTFPPGQGGLPTLRLTCRFEADAGGNPARSALVNRTLEIENANSAGRIGWREIVVAGRGVRLEESDVPAESPSDVLRRYPQDLLASPVDVTRATVITGGPDSSEEPVAGQSAPNKPGGPALPFGTDRLAGVWSDLVARQELTVWFGLLGVVAAVALGALHALAPGHGKTVMAAFLLGERGALRDAAVLGLSVTATHTAGVLVLGTLLSGSATLVP